MFVKALLICDSALWDLLYLYLKSAVEALKIWVTVTGPFRLFIVQFWKSQEFANTWGSPVLVKDKTTVWNIPGLDFIKVGQGTKYPCMLPLLSCASVDTCCWPLSEAAHCSRW